MIHPSAIIHPSAEIGSDCEIGPFCVIGEHVRLGQGNRLHSHVVVDGHTSMGQGNEIFPFATIGLRTQDLKWEGGKTCTQVGDRNTIRENVTVHSATSAGNKTVIGSDNHLLAYAHVAHDVQLGNHIIMSNGATLAGHIVVEDHAVISGLAGVHQFCRIGRFAIVGGFSKVVQDVPPFMLVDGNPAKTKTINKVALERHGFNEEVQTALKKAFKILFRSGLNTENAIERIEKEIPPLPEISHLLAFMRGSRRGVA
ncbi:acyl-ACP--UDP-N-acetylglucosamine O-acyltransferase [Verrucomicrobia bacterium]|nr:acyl-ACP--UDP-N-acetylglucosamine O-acyltransferase [Verrucomicrobiota bacterium]